MSSTEQLKTLVDSFESAPLTEAWTHARSTYPEEACGLFFRNRRTGRIDVFKACANIQNRLHELDPERYPRTAREAYAMDDVEIRAHEKSLEGLHQICGIFHSHNDAGVYFSQEDQAMACPWGEPLFPERFYVICSVTPKGVPAGSVFLWDAAGKKFMEGKLPIKGER